MDPDDGICLASLLCDVDVDVPDADRMEEADDGVPRSASTLSELSLASSASTMLATSRSHPNLLDVQSPALPGTDRQLLLIEVFCTFNGWLVRIEYPSVENGWSYRADMGGHSMHRWEYGNVMILMARHSTCGRAVFPRDICRNCVMKAIWRRECIDPCNTFYLQAMNTVQACIDALRPLVYEASEASEAQVSLFLQNVPKTTTSRKRVADAEVKALRMIKLERALRDSLMSSHGGPLVASHAPDFLLELGCELDKKDASIAMPGVDGVEVSSPFLPSIDESCMFSHVAPPPAPLLQMTPTVVSPQRVVVPASVSPHRSLALAPPVHTESGILVAQTISSLIATPPPLVVGHSAPAAYEELVFMLHSRMNGQFEAKLTHTDVQLFVSKHPLMKTSFAMLGSSTDLNAIASKLCGNPRNCQMLIKTTLSDWIGEVLKLTIQSGSVNVGVGFYAAPTASVYAQMHRSETVPRFVVSGTHRIELDFKAASSRANGVPILVAFHGGVFPMIPGANILPLGIVHA